MKITHNDCVGGVVNNNSAEWLHEDANEGEELGYLEYMAEFGPDDDFFESSGPWLIGFTECAMEDDDAWFAIPSTVDDVDDVAFKIDPNAEYSAIVHESTTQVVRSKWAQFVRGCSPCYPYQGDLDSPFDFPPQLSSPQKRIKGALAIQRTNPINDGIVDQGYGWSYTLPPDVWGEWKPEFIVEVGDE